LNSRIILSWGAAAILVYVAAGSLLNYVVFPEAGPTVDDLPRPGTTIVNESIRSTFVYVRTSIETNGEIFEWDNLIEHGGGPINYPHVHEAAEEKFSVIEGVIRVVVDGAERDVSAGETVVVPSGTLHAFEANAPGTTHVLSSLSPAHRVDEVYVQMARAGGLFRVSPTQVLVFATRYEHRTAFPGLPFWLQRGLGYLIAPTARLFGVKSYYPPRQEEMSGAA
jgi:mannose-6-phosphate isomerase-like protein (cupin superfamily)